jgi:branched-chain amino acid transport system permease protein
MTWSVLLQLIVSGLITGLIYALVSTGLTLIWGLMNLVNFAHGEYLMLAMFSAYWFSTLRHWDPLVSLPLTVVVVALLSGATYTLLIRRLLTASVLAQVFATFGLMVFLQNGAQFLFGPSFRSIPNPWLEGRIRLFGTYIGQAQAVAGAGAFVTTAILYWFMRHTDLGRALDATSQDRGAAAAMGIDTNKMFLLAWAINGALLGVAGSLIASSFYVHPTVGQVFSLIAFVVVALGGFGSIEGAFIAGMLIGVFQTLCGFFLPSQIQLVPVYLVYIAIVLVRPQGLLGSR